MSDEHALINNVTLRYAVAESGPALVWGHGLTSSMAAEDEGPLVDLAALTGHQVVRYDARGHGESESATDIETYSWNHLARDQLALADRLGIDSYVAAGASMGAATALHAAVMAPERVAALVLVIPPTAWTSRANQADMYVQMAEIVETRGVELLINARAEQPPPDPFLGLDDWRERAAVRLRAADPARLAGVFRGAALADLPAPEAIREIACPTLVLAWTGDPGHPVSTVERLAELLPNSERHIASTFDEMATWTSRIQTFLDQTRSS